MLPQLQRCLDPLGSHQPTKNQRTKSFPTTVLGITESREGVGPREPVKNHQRHRCSLTLIRLSEQRWVADADRKTNSGCSWWGNLSNHLYSFMIFFGESSMFFFPTVSESSMFIVQYRCHERLLVCFTIEPRTYKATGPCFICPKKVKITCRS